MADHLIHSEVNIYEDTIRQWFKTVDLEQAQDTFRVVEGILEMRAESSTETRSPKGCRETSEWPGQTDRGVVRYSGEFQRTRIPEPPFRCGFDVERSSYSRYFNHISVCEHADCKRRFVNHMILQSYFARKYGGESGTIPANGSTDSAAQGLSRETESRAISQTGISQGTDRTGIRLKNYRPVR